MKYLERKSKLTKTVQDLLRKLKTSEEDSNMRREITCSGMRRRYREMSALSGFTWKSNATFIKCQWGFFGWNLIWFEVRLEEKIYKIPRNHSNKLLLSSVQSSPLSWQPAAHPGHGPSHIPSKVPLREPLPSAPQDRGPGRARALGPWVQPVGMGAVLELSRALSLFWTFLWVWFGWGWYPPFPSGVGIRPKPV